MGSGTVTPTVSGGTLTNFTITAVNGAWSITKASSTVTLTCPASVVYSGAAQTPCTATVTGAGGLSQSLTVSYTNNTNAGTATASASFAGDAKSCSEQQHGELHDHSGSSNGDVEQPGAVLHRFTAAGDGNDCATGSDCDGAVQQRHLSVEHDGADQSGHLHGDGHCRNPNYVGSGDATLVIYPASSGLTLQLRSGMPEPSPYGTMVYFDLGLGGTPCPTGTVQFFVDGTATGSAVTLNGSSCATR